MIPKRIEKCCPDCGSTNINHYSWCHIHETPVSKTKAFSGHKAVWDARKNTKNKGENGNHEKER